MIDRSLFTPDGANPPWPVPINDLCTVPTEEMAYFLASLVTDDRKGLQVLEIGTGSGYQTAILAENCLLVVSIDLTQSSSVYDKLPANVVLIAANGYERDTDALYDGILVTFCASHVSPIWGKQLKEGGRLVIPLACGNSSRITVYERRGHELILLDAPCYAPFTQGYES